MPADQLASDRSRLELAVLRLEAQAVERRAEPYGLEHLRQVADELRRRYPLPSDRPNLTVIEGGCDDG